MTLRIFFHSVPSTVFKPAHGIPSSSGTPPTAESTLSYLRKSFALTGNKGNMIHSQAPLKLLSHDHSRSVVAGIHAVRQGVKGDFPGYMRSMFDCIVLSLANVARRNLDHTEMVAALAATDLPIYAFGAGIQTALPPRLDVLTQSTQALLRLLGERAKLFAVRGQATAEWLNSVGIKNVTVLGCPSLYVYPRRILSIPSVSEAAGKRVVTAGYVNPANLAVKRSAPTRGRDLIELMEGRAADYVFQDEPFKFDGLQDIPLMYDDSLGELDEQSINSHVSKTFGVNLPFRRYYMFHDASAWRQAVRNYDLYVGDRFHGGVVCMQAGVPALFIASDDRVLELTRFFRLPHTTFTELREHGLDRVVRNRLSEEHIDQFRQLYKQRLREFSDAMSSVKLQLATKAEIDFVLSGAAIPARHSSAA